MEDGGAGFEEGGDEFSFEGFRFNVQVIYKNLLDSNLLTMRQIIARPVTLNFNIKIQVELSA